MKPVSTWGFPKINNPYFGVLIIRILLFRGTISGSPIFGNSHIFQPALLGFAAQALSFEEELRVCREDFAKGLASFCSLGISRV